MPENLAYGCLFCVTGKEQRVADQIQLFCPDVRALVARTEKHKSYCGKKTKEETIFLPSYVFFEAPADMVPYQSFPREHVIRFLYAENGAWRLTGDDARFAECLFRYDGLFGFSKAYREGEHVRIISGPLKDMEGKIQRIDRRGRSGQVCFDFNGRSIAVWLGFDLIDSVTESG